MKKNEIMTVCIIGSGFMGTQVGLQCAVHNFKICLMDKLTEALNKSKKMFDLELDRRVFRNFLSRESKKEILKNVCFTDNLRDAVETADFVIESTPEILELKQNIFRKLDNICPSHTILATTSSSIPILNIENAFKHTDRALNMHFYPLVWERPIVELMKGSSTSHETMKKANRFVISLGLTPLFVEKESMGFIFNRIWRSVKKESLHLVNDGIASFEDIDRAWMAVTGSSIGPFGMMDMAGLDVVRDIEMDYFKKSGSNDDEPPRILTEKIEKGELGKKAGKGFYSYPNPVYEDMKWQKKQDDRNV